MSKVKSNEPRTKSPYHFNISEEIFAPGKLFKIKSDALASEGMHKFIAAENPDLCMTKMELD